MSVKYKADSITVTTEATLIDPGFDVTSISLISNDGAVLLRVFSLSDWGDWITIPKDVSFDDSFTCSKFEIIAASGSVVVNYLSKGE